MSDYRRNRYEEEEDENNYQNHGEDESQNFDDENNENGEEEHQEYDENDEHRNYDENNEQDQEEGQEENDEEEGGQKVKEPVYWAMNLNLYGRKLGHCLNVEKFPQIKMSWFSICKIDWMRQRYRKKKQIHMLGYT